MEKLVGDYQCSFRKNQSTVDKIFSIKIIMEKCYKFNIDIPQLFVDFKQAYDSIDKKLFSILKELGIHPETIRLVRLTLSKMSGRVRIQNGFSEEFEVKRGLRQGDMLLTSLFNLCLEYAI